VPDAYGQRGRTGLAGAAWRPKLSAPARAPTSRQHVFETPRDKWSW
jgi:hypothetical protein